MTPPRPPVRASAVLALAAALVLGACAPVARDAQPSRLPAGRVLLLARPTGADNREASDTAAELLAEQLRRSRDVLGVDRFAREAAATGAGTWAAGLVGRIRGGAWPPLDDGELLFERFGVTSILVTEVTGLDQVWGKYAKFTYVSVEAQAYQVPGGTMLWRLRSKVDVEEKRGRAFQYAVEQAVADLGAAISPGPRFSFVDLWRSWRR